MILSDVIGDPLDIIASGPTVQVRSSSALQILEKYGLQGEVPKEILERLDEEVEDEKYFDNVINVLIGNNSIALQKAFNIATKVKKTHIT